MKETIVTIGSHETRLLLEKEGEGWKAASEGESLHIEAGATKGGWAEVILDGRVETVPFVSDGERVEFVLKGEIWRAEVSAQRTGQRARQAEHSLAAPMPGQVLKIFVETGDRVAKGDPLIVLEAMKMEHQISAPFAGLVESIACRAGELVQPGIDLIVLVPEEEA